MRPDKRHRPSDFQSSYSNRNNRGHNGGGSQGVGGREGNHHSYSHYSSSNRYYRDPNPNHSGRDNYDGTNDSNSQTPFSSNAWGLRGRGGNIDVPTPKDGDNRNNTLQPAIANKFIEEEEKRLSGVNKDTWEQFSHDDRIKSQYQFLETYHDFYQRNFILEDSEEWKLRKQKAANYAAKKVIELMTEHATKSELQRNATTINSNTGKTTTVTYGDSDEDSEDSYMKDVCVTREELDKMKHTSIHLPYEEKFIHSFFDSLQYNLLFCIGFDVKGINPDDEKSCYCPCSKSMKKWRQNFGVDELFEEDECQGYHKRCVPLGLMSHIRKLGGGDGGDGNAYIHRGIDFYLHSLYDGYWGEKEGKKIGHKALYHVNDENYKLAVSEENRRKLKHTRNLQMEIEQITQKMKDQKIALEEEQRKSEKLKKVSDLLYKKYQQQKKNFEALEVNIKPKVELDEQTMMKWRNQTRAFFNTMRRILEVRSPRYYEPSKKEKQKKEKVAITLPHNFVLQKFFDSQCASKNERAPSKSTFLFRNLDETKFKDDERIAKGFYAFNLLLDWDVKYDAALTRSSIRKNANFLKSMQGVDEGGPTSQFISDVCLQLSTLSVMLPLERDLSDGSIILDCSRQDLEKKIFLEPIAGCEVQEGDNTATVLSYNEQLYKASLLYGDGEQKTKDRHEFIVTKVPVNLFEECNCGIIPRRDDFFESSLNRYKAYIPLMKREEIEKKARCYLRAVGRFLVHVIADGRNALPSMILPEMFRNVLLRNCPPGSPNYEKADIMKHLAQMHVEEFSDIEKKFLGVSFEDCGIDKKTGEITKDNFLTEFVPLYFVQPRHENIGALREGITLGGQLPIQDILSCQPLEAINQQFFSSNAPIEVEDVINLFQILYEGNDPDPTSLENHQMFVSTTLPNAIKALFQRNSSFLMDFIFFATGSRCLPQCNGIPSFKLQILFNHEKNDENLPSTHTCEKLIHIPWGVYDNNQEVLMEKLDKAVDYGVKAGFDME